MRQFVDEIVYPDAQAREEDGKYPSKEVFEKMAYVGSFMRMPYLLNSFFQCRKPACNAHGSRKAFKGQGAHEWCRYSRRGQLSVIFPHHR